MIYQQGDILIKKIDRRPVRSCFKTSLRQRGA